MSAKTNLKRALRAIEDAQSTLNRARGNADNDYDIRRAISELDDAERDIKRAIRELDDLE